ncbi:NAD(P)/FAD-dependent oxidoreductase [Steroidobacter flavus]|uniref:NAD(P)/FAD-dependent oxidoreductase n=1 Tax=Steroidobacter flavus TaxID=1842136 RepID=A0ABV8SYD4_9GAMM
MQAGVVIVGAGHAGLQAAASLREQQYSGRIVMIDAEPHPPYERPPLSKGYLLGHTPAARLALRPATFYADRNIELLSGRRATAIDRLRREIILDDSSIVTYERLILATGARNRALAIPGIDLDGVYYLRTLADADVLREQLQPGKDAIVIGAGFIGLEFVACATRLGMRVTVLELASRPMARAVSSGISSVCVDEYQKLGVQLRFNTDIAGILGANGRVVGVQTRGGETFAASLVLVGVGVTPNTELAGASGLMVDNGIVVDQHLRTSDPHISAIGDVAAYRSDHANGSLIRLESIQNASDQARCVAADIVGTPQPYRAVPWFWSDQAHLKLQIAGLALATDQRVMRGQPNGATCAVLHLRAGRLACVETINRPALHLLARRLIASKVALTPEQAADESFELKQLLSA